MATAENEDNVSEPTSYISLIDSEFMTHWLMLYVMGRTTRRMRSVVPFFLVL